MVIELAGGPYDGTRFDVPAETAYATIAAPGQEPAAVMHPPGPAPAAVLMYCRTDTTTGDGAVRYAYDPAG